MQPHLSKSVIRNELMEERQQPADDVVLRMPAEWERQEAVWISFPHNTDTWPSNLADAQAEMQYLVHFLSESEHVRINVPDGYDEYLEREFASELADDRVSLHPIPTNDAWCRDHGAIFVYESDASDKRAPFLSAIDWGYNAWGGKYPPFDLDNAAAAKMASAVGATAYDGGMILEGGAIEVDGSGRLLTTASCLLSPSRNPTFTRSDIESRLRQMLGVKTILWLDGGDVVGDDTDGHIDNLARFVTKDLVVHVVADTADQNFKVLQRQQLQLEEHAADEGFGLVTLPMPEPVIYDGVRLPASYGNFLIANEVVLLPSYGRNDELARSILRELFPARQVQLIPTSNLVVGLGSIHCLTQQVPDRRAG